MSAAKPDIKALSIADLKAWLQTEGESPYRLGQLLEWLYRRRISSFDEMTNLAKSFRAKLLETFSISQLLPETVLVSRDGTKKFAFRLADGLMIESVLIPAEDRLTLCFSTQVGCAMGCDFCLTATMGLKRNLSLAEITGQLMAVQNILPEGRRVSNMVAMGMGEPLHNRKTLTDAIWLFTADHGFGLSKNRITVSTSGLVPEIPKLLSDVSVKLAVSLNATTDEVRNRVMPINKKYPLEVLLKACANLELPRKGRVTFEYVMLHGVNDTEADLARLSKLLAHVPSKINLIPFNPYPGSPYERPPDAWVEFFQKELLQKGFVTCIRHSRGQDILGACGQLAAMGSLAA